MESVRHLVIMGWVAAEEAEALQTKSACESSVAAAVVVEAVITLTALQKPAVGRRLAEALRLAQRVKVKQPAQAVKGRRSPW